MAIETYQTDEARKLLGRIGWPEWEEGIVKFRLVYGDGEICLSRQIQGKHRAVHGIADHIALCLLRNHLLEYIYNSDPIDGPILWTPGDDEALLAAAAEVEAN